MAIKKKCGNGEYTVIINPKTSITVLAKKSWLQNETKVEFSVGDPAVYDSYNLIYTGTITAITEKTVTIRPKYGDRQKRLKLEEFCWRNWDFNAVRIARENSDTMNYI